MIAGGLIGALTGHPILGALIGKGLGMRHNKNKEKYEGMDFGERMGARWDNFKTGTKNVVGIGGRALGYGALSGLLLGNPMLGMAYGSYKGLKKRNENNAKNSESWRKRKSAVSKILNADNRSGNNGSQKVAKELISQAQSEEDLNIAYEAMQTSDMTRDDISSSIGGSKAEKQSKLGSVLSKLGAWLGGTLGLTTLLSKAKAGAVSAGKGMLSDAYDAGGIYYGVKSFSKGRDAYFNGDGSVDKTTGSAKMIRGGEMIAAGGLRLGGKVANGIYAGLAGSLAKKSALAAEAATEFGAKSGFIGKLTGWIVKLLKGIGSKVGATKGGQAISKFAGKIASTVVGKFAGKIATKALDLLARYGQPIGWAITITTAVYDFISGYSYSPAYRLTISSK
jgi:hypothetical protein